MSQYQIAKLRANLAAARPCRLEGFTHGHLEGYCRQDEYDGFLAMSHCGKVKIRLNPVTVKRKYERDECPTFYYE